MDSASDLIMDGPGLLEHPDPAVKERLQSFSELGGLRCKLAEWLNDLGRQALQLWRNNSVGGARKFFKERTATGPLTVDEVGFLVLVWGLCIREFLTAFGMDPEVLVELYYGTPDEYDVKTCSNESLAYLLRHGSDVNLLIGSGIKTKIIYDNGVRFEHN
ncbi:uncharacterized protein LACBIDRAFT_305408 [Laccaria bicolor S238N-H82]|uniref:Predicted protein n=1 Tax=Laccaria bicolor (strain S238N-H82 / ATCC MYA-4686) TaxID=486041 RepID=B0CU56_LACBS|nr:uncharacterized protein LACBIDRAFT_305408 [Laccaria bicolor S238N-H82]EDR14611.1 predicted protein [Laccaria bicolor S238N-H82]|eukprot:XP_001875170.1 predicted protein [Laccaria bicolor S238N-H82]